MQKTGRAVLQPLFWHRRDSFSNSGSPDLWPDGIVEPGRSASSLHEGCCRDAPGPGPRFHRISPRCRPAPPRSPRCRTSQGSALPGAGSAHEQPLSVQTAPSETYTVTDTRCNTCCATPARPHRGSGLAVHSCLRRALELSMAAVGAALRAAKGSVPGSNRTPSELSLKSVADCPSANLTNLR